jgi:3-oxoacyl-[acyl-carrier-protein] synthase II
MLQKQRVVVTGMGALTSLGNTIESSWSRLLQGQSGIKKISKFDSSLFDVQIAGEVVDFQCDLYIPKKEQKKMDTFIHYALACTHMALEQAKLTVEDSLSERAGCYIGVGMGGLPLVEEQMIRYLEKGPSRISPFFIPGVITNLASGQVSMAFNLKGPNLAITSACASGAHALGEAMRLIELGEADVMIAGGTEATVCPLAIGGFAAMKALSTRNDSPEEASRPFDQDRDGFVLSEGGAVFVLESLEHAKKRGAFILCEVTGYGATSDAYHMTSPAPEGAGGGRAMKQALLKAGLTPKEIQYINAHGTSTPTGDELETMAIKNLFEDYAKKVWVSSTKSMTGHALGAAGAIESAFCIMALQKQIVPPTMNLKKPSPSCDLDYVPLEARQGHLTHVMNNSFGFGGTNASLIFSRYEEA